LLLWLQRLAVVLLLANSRVNFGGGNIKRIAAQPPNQIDEVWCMLSLCDGPMSTIERLREP